MHHHSNVSDRKSDGLCPERWSLNLNSGTPVHTPNLYYTASSGWIWPSLTQCWGHGRAISEIPFSNEWDSSQPPSPHCVLGWSRTWGFMANVPNRESRV